MKTRYLLLSLLLILLSFTGINRGFSQIVISGYLANPGGTDSSFEYVQLVATEDIDFSVNPYTVVWANNGAATVKGWVNGAALTYGFALTSGSVVKGDVFYVGGAMKKIDGSGSTDISSEIWIRAKFTGSQNGDGFGSLSTGGNMGNGGTNADGIAIFNEAPANIDSSTIPIDNVFFGTGVGTAKPSTGGYTVAYNDKYSPFQGTFGNGTNTYVYPDVAAANAYFRLTGTYDLSSNTWTTPRTASSVILTTTSVVSNIATAITLTGNATPSVLLSSVSTPSANVIQGTQNNLTYHLVCDVVNLPAVLDSVKFKAYGSFNAGDIKNYGIKLWYSKDANFTTSDSLIDSVSATGAGEIWFKNPVFQLPGNSIAHLFVTTDLSSNVTNAHTLYIDSFMIGDIYFDTVSTFGNSMQPRGGILTFVSPSVNISSTPTASANVIQGSDNNPFYHLVFDVLIADATLDSIKFSTFGNFYSGDIKTYGFKFWYSSDANFSTSDMLIDSVDASGPGDLWFSNVAHLIPVNTSAHFFVTVGINSLANLGDSIYIDSLSLSDIYIGTAIKNGANPQSRGGILSVISSSSPVINVTSMSAFGDTDIGTTSTPQNYTITGGNLFPAAGNIIITPPAGFEISFSLLSGYTDTFLTLPYTIGTINPTDVYVVFKPTQIKAYSGNISHVGGNASQNLLLSGNGISPDHIRPKVDTAYALDVNTIKVVFSEPVSLTAELTKNYVTIPASSIASAVRDASLKIVTLTPTLPLQKGVVILLKVDTNITDTSSNFNLLEDHSPIPLFIPAELMINEISAKSATADDFIEIYNPNLTKPISMKGWYLTNDSASLKKWAFPDTSIAAGGFIAVWDNQNPANPGLHCNFTLNNSTAGEIVLRDNANATIAYTKYPVPKSDTSYGRMPNGGTTFSYMKPTPGASNVLYPKPIPTYTIAQVRTNTPMGQPDSINVYCKLIGTVYGVNFSKSGYSFTIIDNTGGMNIFKTNTTITPPYTVKEGDKVRTIGKIQFYNGLTEMAVDSIIRIDSNQTLKTPLLVTALDETTESNLIRLDNLKLVDTTLWPKVAGTSAVNVIATDLSGFRFTIRIHFKCDLQGTPPPPNRFNIIGLGNQYATGTPYDTGYQIWPRYKADLDIITDIYTPENKLGLELYPNPNSGQFILTNPTSSYLNISVYNSLGMVVYSSVSSDPTISLNINTGKGVYFLKAVGEKGQSSVMKVVVK